MNRPQSLLLARVAALAAFIGSPSVLIAAGNYSLREVADVNPTGSAFPLSLTGFGSDVYFVATGPKGRELYKTHGVGTTLVADINPLGDAFPNSGYTAGGLFVEFQNELYFTASNEHGPGLYRTDGEMTTRISDVLAYRIAEYGGVAKLDGYLIFAARDASGDAELYKWDGASVTQIANINPAGNSSPDGFLLFENEAYFTANGPQGSELYKTDGVAVTRITDLNPAAGNSYTVAYLTLGDKLLFVGEASNNDRELYSWDGSTVTQLPPTNPLGSSNPYGPVELGGNALFYANTGSGEQRYYRTDGVSVTSVPLANAGAGIDPLEAFRVQNSFYFSGEGPTGRELYRTDGNTVSLVADINPTGSSLPYGFYAFGGELYFAAQPTADNWELFKTDGATVTQLADLNPSGSSYPGQFAEADGSLHFTTIEPSRTLYRIDGTAIEPIVDAGALHMPDGYGEWFFSYRDKLYFVLNGPHGREVFVVVPEPATLGLVATVGLMLGFLARQRPTPPRRKPR